MAYLSERQEQDLIEILGTYGDGEIGAPNLLWVLHEAGQATNLKIGDLVEVALRRTDWEELVAIVNAIDDAEGVQEAEDIVSREDG